MRGERCIWKYELVPHTILKMPIGATILCVQTQGTIPCLWALVDPEREREDREFKIYGTGHGGVTGRYVGTFQLQLGALVFHVFEVV